MRSYFIFLIVLVIVFVTGCSPDVYNTYVTNNYTTESDTDIEEADSDTDTVVIEDTDVVDSGGSVEEATYWVSIGGGQIKETNTNLEFVSGTYNLVDDPYSSVDITCFTVTVKVPEDANQGVILQELDYYEFGWDMNDTNWLHGFISLGHGPGSLWLSGDLNIFANSDSTSGAQAYDAYTRFDDNTGIASDFGCWSTASCGVTQFISYPNHYIPAGGQAIIGACTGWVQYDMNSEYLSGNNSYMGSYELGSNGQHMLVLNNIRWTPADSQDLQVHGVSGLFLPTQPRTFVEE